MTSRDRVGFIDEVGADRITLKGWVRLGDDESVPVVKALAGGEILGVATLGGERADVTLATGHANRAFVVKLDRPISAVEVLGDGLRVVASEGSAERVIRLSGAARNAEQRAALLDLVRQVPDAAAIVADAERDLGAERRHQVEANRAGAAGDLSPVPFPVGLWSWDGSARLGRGGHLFLTGGSNALLDRYAVPQTPEGRKQLDDEALAWAELVRDRGDKINRGSSVFAQIIIPEKLTVLRHLAPVHIPGPSPLLVRIEEELRAEPFWVSGLDIFAKWDNPIDPWQRNDSHCSPAGSLEIARALLRNLPGCDAGLLEDVPLTQSVYRDGDLSQRFFGMPIWDEHFEPAPGFLAEASRAVENVLAASPEQGGVVGTHMVWRNKKAPIQKSVVVFGNSYFGSSATEPAKLGWWFARMFGEYHLVWQAEVDYDYIDQVQPDYVIAQTIERFIGRRPAA